MPADGANLFCDLYSVSSSLNCNPIDQLEQHRNKLFNKSGTVSTNQPMEVLKSKPQFNLNTSSLKCNISSISGMSVVANAAKNLTDLNASIQQTALSLSNNVAENSNSWLDLQWSKIRKIGSGLYNLGNNCYLNATLQCMAYTPPLSQWLINKPHSPVCKFKQLKGFCSLCEVEKIIYDIFNSCNGCAKPNSLCFNIKKISNVFGVGTQEDASEFFTTLLESMAKSIKFALNTSPNPTCSKKTTNILDEIFSFQFRSRITCCSCGRLSDTIENTNSWPVDVKYVQDIRKGMLHFLREEILEGENSYKCDRCNKKVRATKKYSIKTAPNILVVNLKRFDFTYAGKLSHFVTYPEMLSLKTFLTDSETKLDLKQIDENDSSPNNTNFCLKNVSYKLYGVLVHLGYTSHSGHYYSYVRGPNDVWYKADDQQMSTVKLQDALSQNAYILFYNRVAPQQMTPPPPPSLTPQPTQAPLPILTPSITPAAKLVNFDNTNLASSPSINNTTNVKTAQAVEETSPKTSSNIPEIKFKSTFVPVDSVEVSEDKLVKHQTLDYDQVLEIKRLNKRKLKLVDNKKKLRELKRQKRHTDSHDDAKSLKKQIRKLKKLIRKQKSKIKRLEKSNKCKSNLKVSSSSSSSSSGSSSCEETSGSVSRKRKLTDANTNSLSLLKQYASSSSSSSSSEDEVAPSKKSIRLSSSRSSSTSDSSTLSTSSSSESNKKDCAKPAVSTKSEQSLQVIEETNIPECLPDQDKKPADDVFVYLKETSLSAVKKWNNSAEDKNKLNEENVTDESNERHDRIKPSTSYSDSYKHSTGKSWDKNGSQMNNNYNKFHNSNYHYWKSYNNSSNNNSNINRYKSFHHNYDNYNNHRNKSYHYHSKY